METKVDTTVLRALLNNREYVKEIWLELNKNPQVSFANRMDIVDFFDFVDECIEDSGEVMSTAEEQRGFAMGMVFGLSLAKALHNIYSTE